MRKTLLIIGIFIIITGICKSQPVNVQSAYNYLNKQKLDKAKNAIDLAIMDSKTSTWAKTWYYRGNIHLNIFISKDANIRLLDSNALQTAYDSYQKAIQLDEKKEFTNEIMGQLYVCGEQYYNKGVEFYNNKMFNKSLEYFQRTANINSMFGKTDTLALYYSALSADMGNKTEEAKNYFLKLYKMNYKKPAVYLTLEKYYKRERDTAKALEVLQKGRQLIPEDLNILIQETNIYLAKGQTKEAQENLLKAIEKDPGNANIYFAIGSNYDKIYYDTAATMQERMNSYREAENIYKKALEIKPEYFEVNYNLGALYFNESVRILEAADKIKDEQLYNAEKVKVEELWQKALPFLEKANQLQPEDVNTLISLKQIYARTKQYEKAKEINQKIEEIKQKK